MEVQVANGLAAQLVLYRYDFQDIDDPNPSALNRYGLRRLEGLLPLLEACPWPLIVEPEPDHPDISETRRLHVLQLLATKLCTTVDDGRVVIAEPPPAGLAGVEAIEIDRSLMEQTRTQGGPMPSRFSSSEIPAAGMNTSSGEGR
jgi:hypothetical protein